MSVLRLAGEQCEMSHPHAAHSFRKHHCHVPPHRGGGIQPLYKSVCVSCRGCMWLRRSGVRTAGLHYYVFNLPSSCTPDNRCSAAFDAVCSSLSSSVFLLHEPQSVRISSSSCCLSAFRPVPLSFLVYWILLDKKVFSFFSIKTMMKMICFRTRWNLKKYPL